MQMTHKTSIIPQIVWAAPMKFAPNRTRSPSLNDSVSSEPTVGPNSEQTRDGRDCDGHNDRLA
jgi:hypothetical protein